MYENINYLATGNKRQRLLFTQLTDLNIIADLAIYDPLIVGTIPIGIDIKESDVDIVLCANDFGKLSGRLTELYGILDSFDIHMRDETSLVCRFIFMNFICEIFACPTPTQESRAWRHMIIKDQILRSHNKQFRAQIINLKKQGIKTEPAFALLLGLKGNSYTALLDYTI